jgi:hypothetical protein
MVQFMGFINWQKMSPVYRVAHTCWAVLWIHIGFNADPDLGNHTNTDPDQTYPHSMLRIPVKSSAMSVTTPSTNGDTLELHREKGSMYSTTGN